MSLHSSPLMGSRPCSLKTCKSSTGVSSIDVRVQEKKERTLGSGPIALSVLILASWTQPSSLVSKEKGKRAGCLLWVSLKCKKLANDFKGRLEAGRRDQETCKGIWSRQEDDECGVRESTNCSFYSV